MTSITLDDMQIDLPGLMARVRSGEEFVVLQDDTPVAEIKPMPHKSKSRRPYGLYKGKFKLPVDFDNPLPEEVLRAFEGE